MRFSSVLTRKRLSRWTSKDFSEQYLYSGSLMGMTEFSSVSIMRRVRKKIMRREKKKKKASFINQLVKQEKLFYSELSMRPMERSGNGFIREDS